jgi:Cd2+/Zn2+-exporting ATPase
MATETRTLTLSIQSTASEANPPDDWRRRWRFHADGLAQTLGPRQGVSKIELDRNAGTLTVDYDPDRFSLDQLQALGQEVGLLVGNAVHHTVINLPGASRTAPANEIEARLKKLPGVAHVAANPLARTLTVEYLDDAPTSSADLLQQLRVWGYTVREHGLPVGWWEQNQLIVYTIVAGIALLSGWLAERAGTSPWLWGPLFVLAYLSGGGFAARNGFNALRQKQIDVDFLMVAAALGAAIIGQWVEGGVLLLLFALSNALEHYAMDRTRQAIRALLDLRPTTARVRRGGQAIMLPVEELIIGDVLDVRPGERLPADGEIVSGQSALDQSPITGESMPVARGVGDPVFAGSINGSGALDIRVTKRAQDSTLARIILLVEEAQSERAPTQRRLDAYEQKYAIGVISIALLVALLPPLFLGWTWAAAFYKSMMLLVVASPCALVISTPASILSAIAAGARAGVLFKGGAYVESLADVRVVAFDKTGTLTVGKPRVTEVEPTDCCSADELLALAATVEARSEHPLAQAIVNAARDRQLPLGEATNLQAVAGKGVSAQTDGRTIRIGTLVYLHEQGVLIPAELTARVETLETQGKTVMLISDHTLRTLGLIAVADTVRPEAQAMVAALKAAGVKKIVMLTGDNQRAAQAIGKAAGVDEVRSELLPEDKVAVIKQLLQTYGSVAMVGDGVNDAPALATATVGIAMGAGGTDVALETADIVLMASDLSKLPYALNLSRKAMRIVSQNLIFALSVIVLLVASAFLNLISLPLGVVGHEGSTVIVVLNGLRLLGYRPQSPLPAKGPLLQTQLASTD